MSENEYKPVCASDLGEVVSWDLMSIVEKLRHPSLKLGVISKLALLTPVYIYDAKELDVFSTEKTFGFTDGFTILLSFEKVKELPLADLFSCIYQSILQAYLQKEIQSFANEAKGFLNPNAILTNGLKFSEKNDMYPLNFVPSTQIAQVLKENNFSGYHYLNGDDLSVTATNQYFKDCMLLQEAHEIENKNAIDKICLNKAQKVHDESLVSKNINFNTFIDEIKITSRVYNYNEENKNFKGFSYQEHYSDYVAWSCYADELVENVNMQNLADVCAKFANKISKVYAQPVYFEIFFEKISKKIPSIYENIVLKRNIVNAISEEPDITKDHMDYIVGILTLQKFYDKTDYEKQLTSYEIENIKEIIVKTHNNFEQLTDYMFKNVKNSSKEIYKKSFYQEILNHYFGTDTFIDDEDDFVTNWKFKTKQDKLDKQKEINQIAPKLITVLKERDLIPDYYANPLFVGKNFGAFYEKFNLEIILKRKEYFLNEGYFSENKKEIDKNNILSILVQDEILHGFYLNESYYQENKEQYLKLIDGYCDNLTEKFKLSMGMKALRNQDTATTNKIISQFNPEQINRELFSSSGPSLIAEDLNIEAFHREILENIFIEYISSYPQKAQKNIGVFITSLNQVVFNKILAVYPEEVEKEMSILFKKDLGEEVKSFISNNQEKIKQEVENKNSGLKVTIKF